MSNAKYIALTRLSINYNGYQVVAKVLTELKTVVKELKVLTEANDEELFFETVVSGFCLDGDLVEVNQLVVEVVMDSKYEDAASKIAEVINYSLPGIIAGQGCYPPSPPFLPLE